MVDGKKMGKGLLEGMDILKGIALGLGGLLLTIIVALIVVGTVTDSVADGNIPVSTSMAGNITALETTATTNVTNITNNIPLIIGLVALVVVLAVIGWLVFGKKGSSSGSEF